MVSQEQRKQHITVLKNELVSMLHVQKDMVAIDCTAGYGGHTELLLEKAGRVIAIDQDPMAIQHLEIKFKAAISSGKITLVHGNFSNLSQIVEKYCPDTPIGAICADFGVSSPQLDKADRGFSFQRQGPLDMRMDTTQGPTAKDIINQLTKSELAGIIHRFGEEPLANRIANAICRARKSSSIDTTLELASIVSSAIPYRKKSKKHPATKTFQAIRIYVNNELEVIEQLLDKAFPLLHKPSGHLGVISFHSLEDRIVKKAFARLSGKFFRESLPKNLPINENEILRHQQAELVKPYPYSPSETAVAENERCRSAKLRVIRRVR